MLCSAQTPPPALVSGGSGPCPSREKPAETGATEGVGAWLEFQLAGGAPVWRLGFLVGLIYETFHSFWKEAQGL